MPYKSGTSDKLRRVLAALDTLAEASLGPMRFQWAASPLGYDPLAALAESLTGRSDRLLESAVDRLLETAGEPGAPEQQSPEEKRRKHRGSWRPQGSAKRDDALTLPGGIGAAGVASKVGLLRRPADRQSEWNAVPGDRMRPGSQSESSQGELSGAVARILARHSRFSERGESAGEIVDPEALKKRQTVGMSSPATPGRANSVAPAKTDFVVVSYRRHAPPAASGELWQSRNTHMAERGGAAGGKTRDSAEIENDSRRIALHSAKATNGNRLPRPQRIHPNDDIQAVLGKTPMSRSGLSAPVEFNGTVAADWLSSWAYGAERWPVAPSQARSPKPTDGRAVVFEQDAANNKMTQPKEGTDGAPPGFGGRGIPDAHSSPLGRLVKQWHTAKNDSSREVSVRESTRSPVAGASLPFGPPSVELATSAVSDMDFVRRLENVLLCESRRHGIVVEDQ
ncbi:MAG: hypothetical protein JSW26_00075 [Desulfobacterales bacterium]|nr:MAG: hypothetical protein JSW26_00075 [Desulfobacterales bacterium]